MAFWNQSVPDFSNAKAAPMPWEMQEPEAALLLTGGENVSLFLLGVSVFFVLVIATLERAGVRRVEDLPLHNFAYKALAILSVPLVLVTEIGLFAVVGWAAYAIGWIKVLVVCLGVVFLGGMAWGVALHFLRRSSVFGYVVQAGASLILVMRFLSAAFLAVVVYRLIAM